jgi:hypothetical protein
MAADVIITSLANSIKADSDSISINFGTQAVPLSFGQTIFNNLRLPTNTIATETLLALRNTNDSGFRFNHTTTFDNNLGLFKLQSFIGNSATDLIQMNGNTISFLGLEIDLNSNTITNSGIPLNDTDLTTKKYVDDAIAAGGGGGSPTFTNINVTDTIYGNSPALIAMLPTLPVGQSHPPTSISTNNVWVPLVDVFTTAYSHKTTNAAGVHVKYNGDYSTAVLFNVYMQFEGVPFADDREIKFALRKGATTILTDTISNRVSVNPFVFTTYALLDPGEEITICVNVVSGPVPYDLTMYNAKLVMHNL